MKRILPLTFTAALLSSCMMGPDFLGATAPELPATWVNAQPPGTSEHTLDEWWHCFRDPQLTRLIEGGFAANPDMVSAALAIEKAESALRSTRSGLFPSLGMSFGGTNSGNYDVSVSHGRWNGALSASWTPDIWGGTRREVEAAAAALGSTKAAAAATRTALASSIAAAYFQWISAKESLRIAQEQLAYQERTYKVTQERHATGMESALALSESRSTIASTRAQIPAQEASIRNCETTLATLLGTTVDNIALKLPPQQVYNLVPTVPTGLPSELLRRRPDVIKAERDLHAATARIGVSVANLFPKLSLTGSTSSGAGTDFSQFWQNSTWNLGASASQTLLNRVALNESVKQAELNQLTSMQAYRKTVLAAFSEVEGCLIEYAKLTSQLPQYEASCAANKESAELSLRLHHEGMADFLSVAAAERAWLSSELNIISTRQNIRLKLAQLCTALGGGWPLEPEKK
ncbi:MAG: TolC family protein [Akkermansia sp.]|nr:TolC family protein [Akkermansia sp.]MBQ2869582.1 TolC family protein [Akkermansia sp.]MBQ8376584.1 TolC family protein [Akkermansia sp.]